MSRCSLPLLPQPPSHLISRSGVDLRQGRRIDTGTADTTVLLQAQTQKSGSERISIQALRLVSRMRWTFFHDGGNFQSAIGRRDALVRDKQALVLQLAAENRFKSIRRSKSHFYCYCGRRHISRKLRRSEVRPLRWNLFGVYKEAAFLCGYEREN